MRRLIAFPCEGETLVGTLDDAPGTTGLLIVSGGNEIRAGAHRAMAHLAARLAADGIPVFRYDRRGIGDSSGDNRGYASAAADLAAAVAAFRAAAPAMTRLVAFGNCDAATTLALFADGDTIDTLILANPWVVETPDDLPPPAAIRARYLSRLRDPRALRRLVRGQVNGRNLFRGLRRIADTPRENTLARDTLARIAAWGSAATVILAREDATAIAYAAAARGADTRTITIDTASHSFARAEDQRALETAIRAAL